jgi:pimeloyl-ACP methyl ester carboxylesterase
VIAPHKYHYNMNTLCPREQLIDNRVVERIDFTVPNDEGKNISAVIIREKHRAVREAVLYFHGNGGTKVEIMGIMPLLVEFGVAVISFDFVGCGNSDEGFLTYGINESADAEIVLREAYKYLEVERLTVWGRSMGAVTAVLFAAKNHKIVDKLVLDSPFRSL